MSPGAGVGEVQARGGGLRAGLDVRVEGPEPVAGPVRRPVLVHRQHRGAGLGPQAARTQRRVGGGSRQHWNRNVQEDHRCAEITIDSDRLVASKDEGNGLAAPTPRIHCPGSRKCRWMRGWNPTGGVGDESGVVCRLGRTLARGSPPAVAARTAPAHGASGTMGHQHLCDP